MKILDNNSMLSEYDKYIGEEVEVIEDGDATPGFEDVAVASDGQLLLVSSYYDGTGFVSAASRSTEDSDLE